MKNMRIPFASSGAILAALVQQIRREIESRSIPLPPAAGLDPPSMDIERPTAADVYFFEMGAIHHLSDIESRIRILSFREMLKSLMKEESYVEVSKSFIVQLSEATTDDLKNELRAICGRLYRRYSLVTAIESVRSNIALRVVFMAGLLSSPFLLMSMGLAFGSVGDAFLLAMMCGAFGAAVSTIVRLYSIDTRNEPLLTWLNLEKSAFSVGVAPFLGSVFAILLLLIFHSGVAKIDVFPQFGSCWWLRFDFDPHACVVPKLEKGFNAAYADVAKAALWCFIAGWAERFVPDALNRITSQGQLALEKK